MARPVPAAERDRILAELLDRRARGETFRAIAATPGFPSRPTLREWLRRRPDLDVPRLRRAPAHWSAALSRAICRRIAEGESLRALCRDPAMPDRKTLLAWARARPGFAARLADARGRSGAPRTGRASRFVLDRSLVVTQIFWRFCYGATWDEACAAPGFPNPRTVRAWMQADPDIARQLDTARRIRREHLAEAYFPMLQQMEREVMAKHRAACVERGSPPAPGPESR